MRKKEPPSPVMAAAGQNAQPSPSVTRALQWKRRSIDQEIEEFRAKKELEFKVFEERLSNGQDAPDQLSLETSRPRPDAGVSQNGACDPQQQQRSTTTTTTTNNAVSPPSTDDVATDAQPTPSPTTPRHDEERSLRGLFVPHFIPLLDSKSKQRDAASASSPVEESAPLSVIELPEVRRSTGPSGFQSPDPSVLSPRTSPSPSLIAVTPAPLSTTDGQSLDLSPSEPLPGQLDSASPDGELPSDLPLLTRSPRRSPQPSASSSPVLASPKPLRPELGTRSSSTQSDASSHSLRSSLRKAKTGGSSHGRKKSVRINIDDVVLTPGGESPVQVRNGWKLPERVNRPDLDGASSSSASGSDSDRGLSRRTANGKRPPVRISHVENVADITSPIPRSNSEEIIGGVFYPKRPILKRGKRPAALDQVPQRSSSSSSLSDVSATAADFVPVYFPPQPLRSPSALTPTRSHGRDLIEPLRTPPTIASANSQHDPDDFFGSDPLFGEGNSANSSRRNSSGEESNRGSGDFSAKPSRPNDIDEEDMFQDYEDGREEADVVNGHDLVDDDEFDDFDFKNGRAFTRGRRISKDDNDGFDRAALTNDTGTGTSPHAGSLPIEIRSGRSWGGRPWS